MICIVRRWLILFWSTVYLLKVKFAFIRDILQSDLTSRRNTMILSRKRDLIGLKPSRRWYVIDSKQVLLPLVSFDELTIHKLPKEFLGLWNLYVTYTHWLLQKMIFCFKKTFLILVYLFVLRGSIVVNFNSTYTEQIGWSKLNWQHYILRPRYPRKGKPLANMYIMVKFIYIFELNVRGEKWKRKEISKTENFTRATALFLTLWTFMKTFGFFLPCEIAS